MIDVAAVTRRLWDSVIRQENRKWLAERLALSQADCGAWLAFWCGAHDIGKVSPCFQSQGKTAQLVNQLKNAEFDFPTETRPHGDITTKVLAALLETSNGAWPGVSHKLARDVAVAVGAHHGLLPTKWIDIPDPRENDPWAAVQRQLLAQLAGLCGVTHLSVPNTIATDDQSIWMYVAGLTSVADWIGSNQTFFPPVGNAALLDAPLDSNAYFDRAGRQAEKALKELGWLDRSDAKAPVSFAQLFPFIKQPRPLQTTVAEIVTGMSRPGILIVEAPMGEGKTEAAWYAAASWDQHGGQGTYIALPTMATSNQMFDRVGHFLECGPGKKNLMLLHGKAALNAQFEKLKYVAQVYDPDKYPSAVVAEAWFAANKKQGLLAPYGVGTVDQALLAVLQTKHVFVRLFGLAGKCVILDEVHAYDTYMTTLMERLLRWLAALGCPVVVLSATLPREKRLKLLRAYAGDDLPEPDALDYPRVTSAAVGGRADVRRVQHDPARARPIELGWLQENDLVNRLRLALANGGCAAVIRNTVGLAQDTFLSLREALKGDGIAVELFHARFPFGRRKQIEDGVLRCYGRTKDDVVEEDCIVSAAHRPPKSVLVATQVVEQSLDLDFDVIVSDIAPVDLVLQRAGRLHRHARGPRPEAVAKARIWLIEAGNKDGLPDFGRPSEYIYAPFVLLRSYLVLKEAKEALRLPDDLERFVEQVYGSETLQTPPGWQAALDEAERELREEQRAQRMKAKGLMIYRPNDEDLLQQQNAQLDEDNPEAAEKIRAATRDTDPTVQVVLVYCIDGHDYLDRSGKEPFVEADKPDLGRVRRLLENEVTINHRGCVAFYADRPVPTGWRERGILRYHRVVRIDECGVSLSGEYPLRLDPDIGVMFTRDTEERLG
jgi:CRISPR-associated endonuclease/helicase Cas3